MKTGESRDRTASERPPGTATDPQAPYVRLAVVGLIHRAGAPEVGASQVRGVPEVGGASGGHEGRWLLLRRRDPADAWDPPGGRMERGEDLTTAVVREVAEETGLAVQVEGPCYALLTVYKGERLLAVSMVCRPMGDCDSLSLEADGASEWQWATSGEWEHLAAVGRSSWEPDDVRKATRMATMLWEAESE